jgi:hypothetical protein
MQRYVTLPFSIVYFLSDLLQLVLLARFLLIFFNANPGNVFVAFIFTLTRPFIILFRSVFSPTTISGLTIDWATIIAMIVYAVIASLIIRLLHIIVDAAGGDGRHDAPDLS